MNHSDFHDKDLVACLKSEAWNDSIESHFDKIRDFLEVHWNDGTHDRVSSQMLEAAEYMVALSKIEVLLDEIVVGLV